MNKMSRVMVIGASWHGSNCTGLARGFRELGHAVELIGSDQFFPKIDRSFSARLLQKIISPFYVQQFNKYILRQISIVQPDIVVVFKGNYVQPETLQQIREHDIWLSNFYPDISFFAHKSVSRDTWKHYHHIFTTKKHGPSEMKEQLRLNNVECIPHGFDKFVHRPVSNNQDGFLFQNEVSFIGGWSPSKEKYLSGLISNYAELDLKIWGDRWNNIQCSELQNSIQGYPVFGDYYALAINNSKINLGLLQDKQGFASKGDQITSRTFHIPASGGFLLHERTQEVLEYYEEDKEIACFDSPEELLSKVRYYLGNEKERQQVAKAGYERCIKENSLASRAQVIIEQFEREAE